MQKVSALAFSFALLVGAGCNQDSPAGRPNATNAPLSLNSLDGVVARHVGIHVGGRDVQATVFAKDLGPSALFVCSYAFSTAADGKQEREAAINEEIDRCVANSGAQVVSRKTLSVADQPAVEVIAKSPKNKALSIRCRVICTTNEIHSLTSITPDNQNASSVQALDKMFEEFRVK